MLSSATDHLNWLYSAAETRTIERTAIEQYGISGYSLMVRAGLAAFDLLRLRWPTAKTFSIFCGSGNNAGDGYVIARLLADANLSVNIICLSPPHKLTGDARTAYQALDKNKVGQIDISTVDWQSFAENTDVIIDAMLGTGLSRPVSGDWVTAIDRINQLQVPVLAIDTPSGLNADTGNKYNTAINADTTITFITNKKGLFTADATDCCGQLFLDDLQLPESIYRHVKTSTFLINQTTPFEQQLLRKNASHKGSYGHVVVIGGTTGMFGAICLAADAAIRSGAGLVTALIRKGSATAHNFRLPEIMCRECELEEPAIEIALQNKASTIAIGPGLGQDDWAKAMLNAAIASKKPLVLDADALNLLAKTPLYRSNWVLTPHPQEAARLLNCTVQDIQNDRFTAARSIAEKFGGICVLKGSGSVIHNGQHCYLINAGNPGMSTAGMGDVLTGIISALISQSKDTLQAVNYAVWIHAKAGDNAAKSGMNGIIASDIITELQPLLP